MINKRLNKLFSSILLFSAGTLWLLPKVLFNIIYYNNPYLDYPFDDVVQMTVLVVFGLSSIYLINLAKQKIFIEVGFKHFCWLLMIYLSSLGMDIIWITQIGWFQETNQYFERGAINYLKEIGNYLGIIISYGLCITLWASYLYSSKLSPVVYLNLKKFTLFSTITSNLSVLIIPFLHLLLFVHSAETLFVSSSHLLPSIVFANSLLQVALLGGMYLLYLKNLLQKSEIGPLVHIISKNYTFMTAFLYVFTILPAFIESKRMGFTYQHVFNFFVYHCTNFILILAITTTLLVSFYILKKSLKEKVFVEQENTSGQFGSAKFATTQDLETMKFYDESTGILSGIDEQNRNIYLPLKNKLTISPQGGGKTTSSSINVLLSHPGNTFVFDIKGELWATTARYRLEHFKHEIVVIDPYGLTKSPDFAKGKPASLLQEYCFNPFDWLPEDSKMRDRMINAFASSFIINEGGTVQHFDDNAKILIRGYIDYMMKALPKEAQNLKTLYELLSEHQDIASETYNYMSRLEGRAQAAANQINRVGSDERGSILSTSYRQIDWIGDSNVTSYLTKSNFDLRQFITGKMDIYVVLPEDQIKEHQRFVRMLLSLVMNLIVQANPSELPEQKMLFLLDELAQLGYCPDIEQAIEVLRARKLVVWTVFQTLSQIKLYKKADLFLGAAIKQIFTNDDVETMQWIQSLGGKKTILTRTVSNNEGDSRQKMQLIGGSVSTGESESMQETGVDLIHLNSIRELNVDQQLIFVQGMRPIQCKKVRYFNHPFFRNKYDKNPLECNA